MASDAGINGSFIGKTLGVLKGSLVMVLIAFVAMAAIGILWRFLDLYETSVKAQTVHARIAMERHQLWMESIKGMNAKEKSLPPDQAKKLLQEQMSQMPMPRDDGTVAEPHPIPVPEKKKAE